MRKTKHLILFTEAMAVYCISRNTLNTMYGKSDEFRILNLEVSIYLPLAFKGLNSAKSDYGGQNNFNFFGFIVLITEQERTAVVRHTFILDLRCSNLTEDIPHPHSRVTVLYAISSAWEASLLILCTFILSPHLVFHISCNNRDSYCK
jgi:hypothetical protein